MLAVDTNVVVRYLVGDDPEQFARATKVIEGESVWISKTVLLETAWALVRTYAFTPEKLRTALNALLGAPTVSVEDDLAVEQALSWSEAGIDFADAQHVASAGFTMTFATFDQALIRGGATSAHA